MRLRREAAILKRKALASIRRAARIFNDYDDEGRTTAVRLYVQHAFEMLLKAGLTQKGINVFDPAAGKSYAMAKCVNLASEHLELTAAEAGLIRTIDAMRDDEQHWFVEVGEPLLYVHARGATTALDDVLQRAFQDGLANHLPARVLPLSTEPPGDIQLLIDSEYSQVKKLLAPGSRKRAEARARIRALLAT